MNAPIDDRDKSILFNQGQIRQNQKQSEPEMKKIRKEIVENLNPKYDKKGGNQEKKIFKETENTDTEILKHKYIQPLIKVQPKKKPTHKADYSKADTRKEQNHLKHGIKQNTKKSKSLKQRQRPQKMQPF